MIFQARICVLAAAAFAMAAHAATPFVAATPSIPVYGKSVTLEVRNFDFPFYLPATRYSIQGNVIDIEYEYVTDGWSISAPDVGAAPVNLGELPPGNYTVNARLYDIANPGAAPQLITSNVPVLAPTAWGIYPVPQNPDAYATTWATVRSAVYYDGATMRATIAGNVIRVDFDYYGNAPTSGAAPAGATSYGAVKIAGEAVGEDACAVKRRIGLVPQELSLYEDLSAIGNLELFGALYGITGAVLAERMRAALELVGLADHARAKPATFSGGMKRRLNIACALVHDPDVLLLDEPTVGVDPQSRNAIFANIEALRERGKAIVYTTHYMEEAERLCDRIVIMDHGRVVASGTKESLRRMLPATGRHRAEIEGLIDDEVLAFLAARGLAVRDADSQGSLEDVFLHLTGKQLRDSP